MKLLKGEMKMKQFDVFTVDQAAIDELGLVRTENKVEVPVLPGQQYRITQVNHPEVRAGLVLNGKPHKGRPRRFGIEVVARLMGEPVPTAPESTDTSTVEDVEAVVSTPAPAETLSDEERACKSEEVTRALGSQNTNDW
jgi:hypothetical protein